MGVTDHVTDVEPRLLQVERLVNSHTLHGSEALCKLLRYLADHAIKHPGVALKEYQIATEVFGRPSGFDPHLDSLVRVQAGRLRAKIAEYYASEGAHDPVIVELRKGAYTLAFHGAIAPSGPILAHDRETEPNVATAPDRDPSLTWKVGLGVFLGLALLAFAWLFARAPSATGTANLSESAPRAFQIFWKPFLAGPDESWVIFSNGSFVGRAETGLRYYNPAHDSNQIIDDHYTGVGEVLAVHNLDQVFRQLQSQIRVKRGSLFSLDDAKNNNLIFVGSPAENLTLLDIPSTHEFVFQRLTAGPRRGDLAVINVHPQADEEKTFLPTPSGIPLVEDYAIIGLVPGMNPTRSFLILAGATTIGTQAAAEYVCRQDSLEQLLLRLSVSDRGEMKPFEAVLRVKVTRGVPVGSEIVALRKLGH
ncbi:MAG TPA: hypothetical protein VJS37_17270 [Terriglobales bacterium]|nr:hypothetical protein [Terriglobales bacterium]